jgi:hypothetical protein
VGEDMRYEKAKDMKDVEFKRLVGVKRRTFLNMLEVVRVAYDAEHKTKRGRKPTLTAEDMILLMLSYLRSYATFFETGVNFGVSESTAHRITVWVENVLITSGKFALPSKRVLTTKTSKIEVILIDVTEQEIERPKKGQKQYYSGKKNAIQ